MSDERENLPSASGAEKFYMCAGSWQAEQGAPASEPASETLQGTAIHQALETGEFQELGADEEAIASRLQEMEKKAILRWQEPTPEGKAAKGPVAFGREERLWIRDRKTLEPLASAKSDAYLVYKALSGEGLRGLVIDYKTGFLPVTRAARNVQMRWQALALWHEHPKLTSIRVEIAAYRFQAVDTFCDYDVPALQRAEEEFLFHVWRSQQADAPRSPGPWCRYCKARTTCPEAGAMAMLPMAGLSMLPSGVTSKEQIAERVAVLPVADLAFLRKRKSLIENILEAVDTRLKSLPPEALAAVGLEKFTPQGNREIKDLGAVYDVLRKGGATHEEILAILKCPIGSVEDLMVPKLVAGGVKTKKAAKEQVNASIAEAVERKEASPRLREISGS